MKGTKCIVFTFVFAFLLSSLVMTANSANPASTVWIPDQQVAGSANAETQPSIASAGDGSLWVAYTYYNPSTTHTEIKIVRSTDGGVTWALRHTKSMAGYDLQNPSIAVDIYLDYVYVVYERVYSSTDYDIFLVRYDGTGWIDETIANNINDDRAPSVACEYDHINNYVFLCWEFRKNIVDVEIAVARSTDRGVTWAVWTPVDHGAGRITDQPSMTYASNHVYIAFRDYIPATPTNRIGLLISDNEGATFTEGAVFSSYSSASVSQPSIAAIHSGGTVFAVWERLFSAGDSDVYYGYSTDYGATWSLGALASSNANEIAPQLTADGMDNRGAYYGTIRAVYEVIEPSVPRTNGLYYRYTLYSYPTSWSTAVQIADDNAYVSWTYANVADRAVTTVNDNVPVVVWVDLRNSNYDVYATTFGGKYTIDTSPSGLQVIVDGTPYQAQAVFYWAYQSTHTLDAVSLQGAQYVFQSWSDGGAQTHTVTVTTVGETTITANFLQKNKAYLVVRGSSNQIFYRTYTSDTDVWGSWVQLPGASNDPSAAAVMGNELHVVVRGVNYGQIWHGYVNLNTNAFSGWSLLDGATPSAPTLTGNSTHLYLVVRGNDNRIYFRYYALASRAWSSWMWFASGTTPDSPAAVLMDNKLQFVVRGSNANQVWHGWLDLVGNAFSGWKLLSGATPSAPVLVSIPNYMGLVVRGENNLIYYRWYRVSDNDWYSGWYLLAGGATSTTPAATIIPGVPDDMEVVVRGTNSDQIWHGTLDIYSNAWSGWTLVDGSTPSKPVLAS